MLLHVSSPCNLFLILKVLACIHFLALVRMCACETWVQVAEDLQIQMDLCTPILRGVYYTLETSAIVCNTPAPSNDILQGLPSCFVDSRHNSVSTNCPLIIADGLTLSQKTTRPHTVTENITASHCHRKQHGLTRVLAVLKPRKNHRDVRYLESVGTWLFRIGDTIGQPT